MSEPNKDLNFFLKGTTRKHKQSLSSLLPSVSANNIGLGSRSQQENKNQLKSRRSLPQDQKPPDFHHYKPLGSSASATKINSKSRVVNEVKQTMHTQKTDRTKESRKTSNSGGKTINAQQEIQIKGAEWGKPRGTHKPTMKVYEKPQQAAKKYSKPPSNIIEESHRKKSKETKIAKKVEKSEKVSWSNNMRDVHAKTQTIQQIDAEYDLSSRASRSHFGDLRDGLIEQQHLQDEIAIVGSDQYNQVQTDEDQAEERVDQVELEVEFQEQKCLKKIDKYLEEGQDEKQFSESSLLLDEDNKQTLYSCVVHPPETILIPQMPMEQQQEDQKHQSILQESQPDVQSRRVQPETCLLTKNKIEIPLKPVKPLSLLNTPMPHQLPVFLSHRQMVDFDKFQGIPKPFLPDDPAKIQKMEADNFIQDKNIQKASVKQATFSSPEAKSQKKPEIQPIASVYLDEKKPSIQWQHLEVKFDPKHQPPMINRTQSPRFHSSISSYSGVSENDFKAPPKTTTLNHFEDVVLYLETEKKQQETSNSGKKTDNYGTGLQPLELQNEVQVILQITCPDSIQFSYQMNTHPQFGIPKPQFPKDEDDLHEKQKPQTQPQMINRYYTGSDTKNFIELQAASPAKVPPQLTKAVQDDVSEIQIQTEPTQQTSVDETINNIVNNFSLKKYGENNLASAASTERDLFPRVNYFRKEKRTVAGSVEHEKPQTIQAGRAILKATKPTVVISGGSPASFAREVQINSISLSRSQDSLSLGSIKESLDRSLQYVRRRKRKVREPEDEILDRMNEISMINENKNQRSVLAWDIDELIENWFPAARKRDQKSQQSSQMKVSNQIALNKSKQHSEIINLNFLRIKLNQKLRLHRLLVYSESHFTFEKLYVKETLKSSLGEIYKQLQARFLKLKRLRNRLLVLQQHGISGGTSQRNILPQYSEELKNKIEAGILSTTLQISELEGKLHNIKRFQQALAEKILQSYGSGLEPREVHRIFSQLGITSRALEAFKPEHESEIPQPRNISIVSNGAVRFNANLIKQIIRKIAYYI